MSTQIKDLVTSCSVCNTYRKCNTKEPLLPHSIPSRPWSKVGADLFELGGKQYLILVDYYSGFIEVDLLNTTTSNQVITHCKSQFSRHGIPDILITDNGPQFFCANFTQFAKDYQFEHRTTSPYHAQSNGMAEKSVQTVKNLIKKALHDRKDPYLALLEYRNTPHTDNIGSPAQRLMGRRTKTLIPTTEKLLQPKTISPTVVQKELKHRKALQKYYYNQHAKPLAKLSVGENVLMQVKDGKWSPAKVTGISHNTPRSYFITTPQGQCYRRNRKYLRKDTGKGDNHVNVDDYMDDDTYDETIIPADESSHSSQNTQMSTSQTQQIDVPVRRSQRTIKKPVRYSDSLY